MQRCGWRAWRGSGWRWGAAFYGSLVGRDGFVHHGCGNMALQLAASGDFVISCCSVIISLPLSSSFVCQNLGHDSSPVSRLAGLQVSHIRFRRLCAPQKLYSSGVSSFRFQRRRRNDYSCFNSQLFQDRPISWSLDVALIPARSSFVYSRIDRISIQAPSEYRELALLSVRAVGTFATKPGHKAADFLRAVTARCPRTPSTIR